MSFENGSYDPRLLELEALSGKAKNTPREDRGIKPSESQPQEHYNREGLIDEL